jgi:hypothetical protein
VNIGSRVGRLVLVKKEKLPSPNRRRGEPAWLCECDCGTLKIIHAGSLRKGSTKSCGCLLNELSKSRRTKFTKEDYIVARRRAQVKYKYGLSLEELSEIADFQQGRCAICRLQKKLVIDHDHASSSFRGLLCNDCNLILGYCGDDTEVLQRAILYLRRSSRIIRDES